ncbi:MAG TPA: protoporphyrinogen oxidase [Mycobacteriales bacterium]|nr:protoporphyrinogen oxidase [Mycobacteriales bacterium]
MARVAVVGGGIAGLAAGYAAAQAGHAVTVYERAGILGGALRTGTLGGLELEEGADAFLIRVPEALELARQVGCTVVHPASGQAQVYAAGRLRPLPPGTVLGVPGGLRGLRPVLSRRGLARAGMDRLLPASALGDDPAVGLLVRRRLGAEVLDRLVDPLLGGVYAGSATGLSVQATAPLLAAPRRSLLATVAARRPAPSGGPVFGSVIGGQGEFVAALARALLGAGGQVRTGETVTALARDGAGWRLGLGPTGRRENAHADVVILAVPAPRAARLLADQLPAPLLPATAYASVAIVGLLYRPGTPLPPGSGFLVAPSARRVVKAVSFVGQKWGHPPDAPVVVRASIGRYRAEVDLQRPDLELAGLAAAELAAMAGVPGRPQAHRVTRWGGALPQYAPGHLTRVRALRAALPAGLAVCGAAYDGVGIPACVRSGQAAAAAIGG